MANVWEQVGVAYLTFPWSEDDQQKQLFDENDEVLDEIVKFIEEAGEVGESTLVHSFNGQSHSCCILAAYFMRKFNWALLKTLEFLNSRRADLEIHASFFEQLTALEEKLKRSGRGAQLNDWQNGIEGVGSITTNQRDEVLLRNTYLNSRNAPVAEIFQSDLLFQRVLLSRKNDRLTWKDTHHNKSLESVNIPLTNIFDPLQYHRQAAISKRVLRSCFKGNRKKSHQRTGSEGVARIQQNLEQAGPARSMSGKSIGSKVQIGQKGHLSSRGNGQQIISQLSNQQDGSSSDSFYNNGSIMSERNERALIVPSKATFNNQHPSYQLRQVQSKGGDKQDYFYFQDPEKLTEELEQQQQQQMQLNRQTNMSSSSAFRTEETNMISNRPTQLISARRPPLGQPEGFQSGGSSASNSVKNSQGYSNVIVTGSANIGKLSNSNMSSGSSGGSSSSSNNASSSKEIVENVLKSLSFKIPDNGRLKFQQQQPNQLQVEGENSSSNRTSRNQQCIDVETPYQIPRSNSFRAQADIDKSDCVLSNQDSNRSSQYFPQNCSNQSSTKHASTDSSITSTLKGSQKQYNNYFLGRNSSSGTNNGTDVAGTSARSSNLAVSNKSQEEISRDSLIQKGIRSSSFHKELNKKEEKKDLKIKSQSPNVQSKEKKFEDRKLVVQDENSKDILNSQIPYMSHRSQSSKQQREDKSPLQNLNKQITQNSKGQLSLQQQPQKPKQKETKSTSIRSNSNRQSNLNENSISNNDSNSSFRVSGSNYSSEMSEVMQLQRLNANHRVSQNSNSIKSIGIPKPPKSKSHQMNSQDNLSKENMNAQTFIMYLPMANNFMENSKSVDLLRAPQNCNLKITTGTFRSYSPNPNPEIQRLKENIELQKAFTNISNSNQNNNNNNYVNSKNTGVFNSCIPEKKQSPTNLFFSSNSEKPSNCGNLQGSGANEILTYQPKNLTVFGVGSNNIFTVDGNLIMDDAPCTSKPRWKC